MVIAVVEIAGLLSCISQLFNIKFVSSCLIGLLTSLILVLLAEILLPYNGGGASLFMISIFFGGLYGSLSGLVGAIIGWHLKKSLPKNDK